MNKIIKFPKEKSSLISTIIYANEKEDYQKIIKYKDELFDCYLDVKDTRVFEILIKAYTLLCRFDDAIMICEELIKKGYESFDIYTYAFASLIGANDIFKALSLINNSKILNQEKIKSLYDLENANYSNILCLSSENYYEIVPCMILVNYLMEIKIDLLRNIKINREYLVLKFLDLSNILYELGYDEHIFSKLEEIARAAFELDM